MNLCEYGPNFFDSVKFQAEKVIFGDAEVELLPNDLRLFSGYFWQILANLGYFLVTVWLILSTLG